MTQLGKRVPLNMRSTKELRDKIAQAAMESGRSLVGEVEYRLEKSFWADDLVQRIQEAMSQKDKPVMRDFDWNRHDEDMVRAINAAMAKDA